MTLKNTVVNELFQEYLKRTNNTKIDTVPLYVQEIIFGDFIRESVSDNTVKNTIIEAIKGVL